MRLRNTLIGAAAIVVVLAVVVLAIAVKRASDPAGGRQGPRDASASRAEVAPVELLRGDPEHRRRSAGDEPSRSARQRRVDMVAAIEGSGSAAEAWSEQGDSLLRALGAHAVAITQTGCFLAGCAAVVTFSSTAEYQRRRAELEATSAFAAWTGSKRWAEPEALAGGQVIVALILDRPD